MENEYDFCLTNKVDNLSIHFNPNGFDTNGYPQWISNDMVYSINFNPEINIWKVMGGDLPYIIYSSSSYPPLNSWYVLGANGSISINMGECNLSGLTPLTYTTNNPICSCDGTIILKTSNGVPPYQYSIDNGVTYSNSPIFSNLCSGMYSLKIIDSSGNTVSNVVTLTDPKPTTLYKIKLLTTSNVLVNTNNVFTTQYFTSVEVTPQPPSGVTITFDVAHNNVFNVSPTMSGSTVVTNSILSKNSIEVPISYSGWTFTDSGTNPIEGCQNLPNYLRLYNELWSSITYNSTDQILIETTTTINKIDSLTPCSYGNSEDFFTIVSSSISGCGCCGVQ